MKKNEIRIWLILSLVSMVLIPLIGAFALVNDILNSSFNLTSQQEETTEALEIGQNALKELAKKNPDLKVSYREQFMYIQDAKINLVDQALLKKGIQNSLIIYFLIIFAVMILISLSLALVLHRKVAKAYDRNFQELLKQQERTRFLEEMNQWQDIAKQLAHEIKNPLQPIRTWMKNLLTAYNYKNSNNDFSSLLTEATNCVDQEVFQLERFVDSFTRFSRLPDPEFQTVELNLFISEFIKNYNDSWNADYSFISSENDIAVHADPNLLRQVFSNLMNNASEANPQIKLTIKIQLYKSNGIANILFENDGNCIEDKIIHNIFEPHITTKKSEKNFGLGLSIVRKIILEHKGEINLVTIKNGAKFKIQLPIIGELNGK